MNIRKKFYAAVLCGLAGVFSFVPPAGAITFPGRNGNIAFSQTAYGVSNIWLVNAEDKQIRQFTYFGAHNPVWSPDGKRMVATSLWGQLQILDKRGRPDEWLPFTPGFKDSAPVWSSDGLRIAFVRTETGSARSAVFNFTIGTKRLQNVSGWASVSGYRSPSWSPDNRRIVYERLRPGQRTLIIKDVASGGLRELATLSDDVASNVAWSPDGKKIAFNDSAREVYTIWPDGSHRTVVSDGDSQNAVWSPDGNKLAFIEDGGISLSEPDGTVMQVYPGSDGQITYLTWSPDGSKLAFIASEDKTSKLCVLLPAPENVEPIIQTNNRLELLNWQAR